MYEKTELEKRWEEEEKAEASCASCEEVCEASWVCEGECKSNPDDSLTEKESDFVHSPLARCSAPLTLVMCNNRIFLGGLLDVSEGGVVIDHPMVYLEIPDPKNQGRLQVGVQKIFHGLPVPDNMMFKYDALNILKVGDRSLRLASLYEDTYKNIMMSESGLSMPSMQDIANINKNG